MKKSTIILSIAIGITASFTLGTLLTVNQYLLTKKSGAFKMLQYNVEPTCINHVQYYAIGDVDGLHAVAPAFIKDGKTIECNFEQGK